MSHPSYQGPGILIVNRFSMYTVRRDVSIKAGLCLWSGGGTQITGQEAAGRPKGQTCTARHPAAPAPTPLHSAQTAGWNLPKTNLGLLQLACCSHLSSLHPVRVLDRHSVLVTAPLVLESLSHTLLPWATSDVCFRYHLCGQTYPETLPAKLGPLWRLTALRTEARGGRWFAELLLPSDCEFLEDIDDIYFWTPSASRTYDTIFDGLCPPSYLFFPQWKHTETGSPHLSASPHSPPFLSYPGAH